MSHMALLATQSEPSSFEAAQEKSPVIYTFATELDPASQDVVIVKETRNLLSAGGSTGMRTWDAALHLASYLLRNQALVKDRRVLELGAGTGFLSILCAGALRASKVVSTDGAMEVVDLIRNNLGLNEHCFEVDNCHLSPEVLRWGREDTLKLHENHFPQPEPCDCVIATDVVSYILGHPPHSWC